MITPRRKPDEWKGQYLYPGFIPAIISGTMPDILNVNLDSRGRGIEHFRGWISGRFRSELGSLAHSDLVLNRTPLKNSDEDINGIDDENSKRQEFHRGVIGIAVGGFILLLGFIVSIKVGDDICDGKRGIAQICAVAFCLFTFVIGQITVVANLLRIVGKNG